MARSDTLRREIASLEDKRAGYAEVIAAQEKIAAAAREAARKKREQANRSKIASTIRTTRRAEREEKKAAAAEAKAAKARKDMGDRGPCCRDAANTDFPSTSLTCCVTSACGLASPSPQAELWWARISRRPYPLRPRPAGGWLIGSVLANRNGRVAVSPKRQIVACSVHVVVDQLKC